MCVGPISPVQKKPHTPRELGNASRKALLSTFALPYIAEPLPEHAKSKPPRTQVHPSPETFPPDPSSAPEERLPKPSIRDSRCLVQMSCSDTSSAMLSLALSIMKCSTEPSPKVLPSASSSWPLPSTKRCPSCVIANIGMTASSHGLASLSQETATCRTLPTFPPSASLTRSKQSPAVMLSPSSPTGASISNLIALFMPIKRRISMSGFFVHLTTANLCPVAMTLRATQA
mmetsp:Transcript_28959/g.73366  ORF Transcript_28959/g.73366 Transcript_28959/m.73366 type:complete len:230 (+) Transcript_28959:307-996(+)